METTSKPVHSCRPYLLNFSTTLSEGDILISLNRFIDFGFKHISDKNVRPLIQYITLEWNINFWTAFLSRIRRWDPGFRHAIGPHPRRKIFSAFFDMIQMFKVPLKVAAPLTSYVADSDYIFSSELLRR